MSGDQGNKGIDGIIGFAGRPGGFGAVGAAGLDSDIDYNALNAIVADLLRNEILQLKAPNCRHLNASDAICPACNNSYGHDLSRSDAAHSVKQPALNF